MLLLANGLVIVGACFLIAALYPVWRLIVEHPLGRMRRHWYFLTALIIFSIAGYVGYVIAAWNTPHFIVSTTFFFGACFVLEVNTLAMQTMRDLRRLPILEQENIMDPLMQIYNRRYLERFLQHEVVRSQRYNQPLSTLLLDIDHFKQVNDTHGHQVGDYVLEKMGALIVNAVRDVDVAARYGGEEVLIITPNTPTIGAAELAERLRRIIEDAVFVSPGDRPAGREVRITVSIGVASLNQGVTDMAMLLRKTDEALYEAKRIGRNRVFISREAGS